MPAKRSFIDAFLDEAVATAPGNVKWRGGRRSGNIEDRRGIPFNEEQFVREYTRPERYRDWLQDPDRDSTATNINDYLKTATPRENWDFQPARGRANAAIARTHKPTGFGQGVLIISGSLYKP